MTKYPEMPPLALPFPTNLRGQCAELEEEQGFRFFEVFALPYDADEALRLEAMGVLEESVLGSYLKNLDPSKISSGTSYLYKLQTYLADPTLRDPWKFNESATSYQEHAFTSFEDLLRFCQSHWGLTIESFRPQAETRLPG